MNNRNSPCWCGSGKKYKKCHLQADEVFDEATRINKRIDRAKIKPNNYKWLALEIMIQESMYRGFSGKGGF